MTIKSLLVAAVLAVAPTLGFAQGCEHDDRQAMSCGQGMSYDADTGRCVTGVSS